MEPPGRVPRKIGPYHAQAFRVGLERRSMRSQRERQEAAARFPHPDIRDSFAGFTSTSSALSGSEWTRQDFILKAFHSAVEPCFRAWR
jgi:hypothetical protein